MHTPPRRPRFFLQVLRRRPSLLVCHVGDRVARFVEQTLATQGIDSREFAILSLLVSAQAPMGQEAIAARLGRDATTVLRLVRSLETKLLVSRGPDRADRRVRMVRLTPRGVRLFEAADGKLASLEKRLFLAPTPENDQGILQHLKRLM